MPFSKSACFIFLVGADWIRRVNCCSCAQDNMVLQASFTAASTSIDGEHVMHVVWVRSEEAIPVDRLQGDSDTLSHPQLVEVLRPSCVQDVTVTAFVVGLNVPQRQTAAVDRPQAWRVLSSVAGGARLHQRVGAGAHR